MLDKKECCGTCEYCKFDPADDDWVCTNQESESWFEFVPYGYHCDEYEERA